MQKSELDKVLSLLKSGKNKAEIRKTLDLKPSALANRLRRLEQLGEIERQGKYIIKVLSSSHKHPKVTKNLIDKKLNKRGHAFNFKVIFPNEEDLRNKPEVQKAFMAKKLEKLGFNSLKLTKDNNTIWINKGSLTIYSNNSYYASNALYSKFKALKEIDNLIIDLKGKYGFKGLYGIEVFREHYGLIFNRFAEWLIKNGGKLYVKNKGNKAILWVDNSRKDDIGLTEFEGENPLSMNKADDYFKDQEKTNWEVTPSFILKGIQGNAQNLAHYAQHLTAHVDSVKQLGKNSADLTAQVVELTKVVQELKNETFK